MICFVFLTISLILFIGTGIISEKTYNIALPIALSIIAMVILIVGSINTICFIDNTVSYEADCAMIASTRAVYEDELEKYDEMRDTDITASSTYLELREKIIDFNHDVDFAKSHDNIWLRNAWFSPAYLTVDTIDLEVG